MMTPGRYRKAMILYYADLERRMNVLHPYQSTGNRQKPKAWQKRPARKVPKRKVRQGDVRS